ncbi:MAG: hypothetical protein ACK4SX_12955 [Alcanivoracaceae bacterium]
MGPRHTTGTWCEPATRASVRKGCVQLVPCRAEELASNDEKLEYRRSSRQKKRALRPQAIAHPNQASAKYSDSVSVPDQQGEHRPVAGKPVLHTG